MTHDEYCSLNTFMSAVTGRFSSSRPNVQRVFPARNAGRMLAQARELPDDVEIVTMGDIHVSGYSRRDAQATVEAYRQFLAGLENGSVSLVPVGDFVDKREDELHKGHL